MGFKAVSMRDLASEMEIKASSLYNHISSKEEILTDIILHIGDEFIDGIDGIIQKDLSFVDKLQQVIKMHVNVVINYPDEIGVLNNDWKHLSDPARTRLVTMRSEYEDKFRSIIKQGIKEDHLIDVNPEIMLFSILSTLRSMNAWYLKRGEDNIDTLTDQVVRILLRGVLNK
jgi:AcrR family transcriptional regulator